MIYLDLDDINSLFNQSWFWGVNRTSIVSFNRSDFHGDSKLSLKAAVKNTVLEKSGLKANGPIRMLAHLRYMGYCFNPVTFYYCYDKDDKKVDAILAEVTNTPWKERHAYVLKANEFNDGNIRSIMDKKLHVSPFWDMNHTYDWVFSQPKKALSVYMKNIRENQHVFDATLNLKRIPLTKFNLVKVLINYPIMTFKVVFRIHFQALILWLKGAIFQTHPSKL